MALTDDRNLKNTTDTPECGEISALLFAYVRGELDSGTAVRVKAHTDSCPICAEELKKTAKLAGLIADSGRKPEKSLTEGLYEKIDARERAAKNKVLFKKRYIAYASTAAAALLVVICISGGKLWLNGGADKMNADGDIGRIAEEYVPDELDPQNYAAVLPEAGDAEKSENNAPEEMITESYKPGITLSPTSTGVGDTDGVCTDQANMPSAENSPEVIDPDKVTVRELAERYAALYDDCTVYGVIIQSGNGYNYASDVSEGFTLSKPDIITVYDTCDVYVYTSDVNKALKELSSCLDGTRYRFGAISGSSGECAVIVFCLK